MDRSTKEHYVEELYFLITKFLETGPCKESVQKLKEEITKNKILPKRLDWEGNEHEQSFEELESKYPHISPQHLLEICKRIGPIVDKEILPCAPGVRTLLGAGSQSLLRNKDVVKKHLRLTEFIVRRHCRSIYSPVSCLNHNIVQVLYGQEISGPACRKHIFSPRLYNRSHLLTRTLGHLTAVYCLLFDQTGKFVITGADDLLVKIWSAVDGRLLCTLRGASAEITDIAINIENTLLAAGSLDKLIRVWCLQTASPVATLSAHTGMITGVNFCPNMFNGCYQLVSTSTDGSVAFWSYTTDPVLFQTKPILYNEKIRPGQAQMICSSFSYGGAFLATGSADHHVRVYSMSANPPHRILEMEKHSDRVDSLLWANRSLKFISGSKDGTAIIWQYRAQAWQTKLLDMASTLPSSAQKDDDTKLKLKVTMVCWSCDDSFVLTAVNNFVIKVWNASGKLLRELSAHREVVYVLEFHPLDPAILMSAGHDGIIFLWDLRSGEQLFQHQNYIEGQGSGAIFDAKWSPDGTMMAATDSHGHLLFFGIAEYNDKMKSLPKELFFHTDYRPLVRDSQNNMLDEQTQTPPHLMPPPFLVDVDGNPYPPHLQKLVPGRELCSVDQLIPNIIYTPGGQPEVVQFINQTRSSLDQRIEELNQQNSINSSRSDTSPPSRIVQRGEVETLRPAAGSWDPANFSWRKRILISPLPRGALETLIARIKFFGDIELEEYERERKREVEYVMEVPSLSSKKPKRKLLHNYRTRATRDTQEAQPDEEEGSEVALTEGNSSDITGLSEESSSESSSSEYSDWVAEHSVNLEPPQRSRRTRKRKPPPPLTPQDSPPHQPSPEPSTSTAPPAPTTSSKKQPVPPPPEDIKEIPELYRPSEWLSEVIPKKFPYYPQMGDEVMFFAQGYELYLKAVADRKVYELAKSQLRPWGSLELQEPELVKVIGIKYELRPPRLCCLRLAVMRQNGTLTGDRFTIKYHDVPDVIDFFILKQTYDTAMMRNWKIGDRFRSMIDDGWWWGEIEGRRPHASSAFLCHRIRWDNGETEDMSPWDMEPIDPDREPEKGGSVPVLGEEIAAILYHPRRDEWPGGDRESYCQRTIAGLEEVMGLSIAEPFSAPVDINTYKSYAFIVEFPIDLSTILARFENRFYRRLTAAQFDIRYIATNAEKFNEPHSIIVKNARIVTDLCLKICKENELVDVPSVYRELMETYESTESEDEGNGRERAAASRSLRAMRRANHLQPDWRRDCRQLLEVLWACQDSQPFRGPVDRIEHPDYHKVVATPMDLGQIREELKGNNYSSPTEFCKDLRLIFSNSRQYNTNKRSKIYVMTVRLAAIAEEHMKRIIKDWKAASRKQNKKLNGLRTRRQRKSESDNDSGGSAERENSGSGSEEAPTQPSHSRTQSSIRPKRIKVLLPKVNESSSSNTNFYSSSKIEGKYKTPASNVDSRPVRTELSNEDSNDPIRPLRLRVPVMKKLKHFVSTSETDSSSQPSSSSGHRSLRATKAVSYVENYGEESSQSSNDERPKTRILTYNMRSSVPSQILFAPRVNYNEESSSESGDKEVESQHPIGGSESNWSGQQAEESGGQAAESGGEAAESEAEAGPSGEAEVQLNGAETSSSATSSSASSSSTQRFVSRNSRNEYLENSSNLQEKETSQGENNEESSETEEEDEEEQYSDEEWGSGQGRQSGRGRSGGKHYNIRKGADTDKDYQVEDDASDDESVKTSRSRRARATGPYKTRTRRSPDYGEDNESSSDEESEEETKRSQKSRSSRNATAHPVRHFRPRRSRGNEDSEEEEDSNEEGSKKVNLRPQKGFQRGQSGREHSGKSFRFKQEQGCPDLGASDKKRGPRKLSTDSKQSSQQHQKEDVVDEEAKATVRNRHSRDVHSRYEAYDHQVDVHAGPSSRRQHRKRKMSSDSSEGCQGRRRSGRARRPLKRPNYTYDSGSELGESGGEEKPRLSISSRGRVRKISARARAFLLD